jgi:hypothetical protein
MNLSITPNRGLSYTPTGGVQAYTPGGGSGWVPISSPIAYTPPRTIATSPAIMSSAPRTTLPVSERAPIETTGGSTGGLSSGGSTPSTSTPPTNTGGAGLAGNGPLIDALTAALSGGGFQSPLDAMSSPSTAALQSLQPTATQTSTSSAGNPALLLIIGAIALGAIVWYVLKHKKKKPAEQPPA